jgi:hypothetical protein
MKKTFLLLLFTILIINICGYKFQNIEIIGKGGGPSNLIFPTGIYLKNNKL